MVTNIDPRLGAVADVAKAIQMAAADDDKLLGRTVFFIGAGCSKSAGIPLVPEMAQSLVLRLAKKMKAPETVGTGAESAYRWLASGKYIHDCCIGDLPKGTDPDSRPVEWSRVYDEIFSGSYVVPDDVREIFSEFVDGAGGKINWAHLCLGELVRRKLVSTVITTNFDQLVLAGSVRSGVLPVVCDGIESLTRIRGAPHHPQVVELHGSRHTYRLRNSAAEVAALADDEQTIGAISSIFQDLRAFVVVGYGGREDGIMDLLIKAAGRFSDKRLIWLAHGKDPNRISDKAKSFLGTSRNALLLVDQDADSFFLRLLQTMGIGAPETIREPLFLANLHASTIAAHDDGEVTEGSVIQAEVDRYRSEIQAMDVSLIKHRSERDRAEMLFSSAREARLAGKLSEALTLLRSATEITDDISVWIELAAVAQEIARTSAEQEPAEIAVEAWQYIVEKMKRDASLR